MPEGEIQDLTIYLQSLAFGAACGLATYAILRCCCRPCRPFGKQSQSFAEDALVPLALAQAALIGRVSGTRTAPEIAWKRLDNPPGLVIRFANTVICVDHNGYLVGYRVGDGQLHVFSAMRLEFRRIVGDRWGKETLFLQADGGKEAFLVLAPVPIADSQVRPELVLTGEAIRQRLCSI